MSNIIAEEEPVVLGAALLASTREFPKQEEIGLWEDRCAIVQEFLAQGYGLGELIDTEITDDNKVELVASDEFMDFIINH